MHIGADRTVRTGLNTRALQGRTFLSSIEPAVALFALRGLRTKHAYLLGDVLAQRRRGDKQVLHKTPRLARPDAGELLKQSSQPVDRGHDPHLSITGDELDKIVFLTYACTSHNRTGRQPCKNWTEFLFLCYCLRLHNASSRSPNTAGRRSGPQE